VIWSIVPAASSAAGSGVHKAMTVRHLVAAVAFLCWIGAEPGLMEFTTVGRGDLSQIDEPRQVVVRTAAEWSALWKQHAGGVKPPAIDLTRSIVIGVFLGSRPTAGYTVEITRIENEDAALVVTYREQGPAADAMVAQMLTAPFHIVRTQSHSGPVRFQRTP
jgi:protease stability complex PrcB-like protein